MSKEKYTALILGANGLIGTALLQLLLENDQYACVYTVSRKKLPFEDDKLIQIIADYDNILPQINTVKVDHFYCCIGTTKNKVANEQEYYKIDHDYPIIVANCLKNNGCNTINIVSSIGANSNTTNFYLKLKGKVEQSVIALHFQSTNIFRPSLLIGKRSEKRLFESIAQRLSPLMNILLIGKLKNYQSIKASVVASAMLNITLKNKIGTHIYQTEEIKENA
ncbi:NAD-dependent epimerase/dehydratase family protein [Sphingobacterium rhinopitheci]|uniref:NAD-dependent epimerase/dehydratase family protein n=1 Tax=Sphingobacterium rhinopitheci TaxID=2781960 RepID=UPI001F523540|nr:NAD-dependent epimerase/dehydratase family protein [Sphingobacterium rhinopitheci]MCI0921897.1 NAD-dependent epimerase/dehydratase family protein [Sphingobacterium rhinopitheci]